MDRAKICGSCRPYKHDDNYIKYSQITTISSRVDRAARGPNVETKILMKLHFEDVPRPVQVLLIAIYGWRNRAHRFGAEYQRQLSFLKESKNWDEAEITTWQRKRLQNLLVRAQAGSPYHRNRLPSMQMLNDISMREALDLIPILQKEALRSRADQTVDQFAGPGPSSSTSGSTGTPMLILHDWASIQRRQAFLADHIGLSGISPFDPSLRLSGRVLFKVNRGHARPWLRNPAENQMFISTYHLNERHKLSIRKAVIKHAPVLIDGYPSAILELLRLLSGAGDLSALKAVVTTAETLNDDMRSEIEERAEVPVLDYYAASEGVPFIQQCPYGIYHVRWQSGIFEVETSDGIAFEGDGELICTSFVQNRTPLIRYRTGDRIEGLRAVSPRPCQCGLQTATVKSIGGRVEDLVRTPDGRALGMFTYRTLKNIDGIQEAQVIQVGYEVFAVNVVLSVGGNIKLLREEIRASFERALGYSVTVEINVVDQLPKGPNGKVRLVRSELGRDS